MTGTPPLRRTLGVRDAVGVGLGSMLGAGVFVVWAPAAASAGSGRVLLLALGLAALVAVCNAWSSAALAVRYPRAGGSYVYGRERLGELPGFVAGWCFVVGKTASCAAMAMTVAAYAAPGHERPAGAVAVVVVAGLAVSGVQRSARISLLLAGAVLAVLLAVVVASWNRGAGSVPLAPGAGEDGGIYPLLQAAGLLFFAFAGYARIATLAEEVERPERTIPRAMLVSVAVVLTAYLVVAVTVLRVLGPDLATTAAPLLDAADRLGGGWVGVVRVAAVLAAVGALLNLLLGISRTAIAMSRDGHLPHALTRTSTPGVPVVTELAVAVLVLALVLVVDLRGAIGFSSFGVLLYYAVANASALTLRGDWRGAPVVPAVGLVGCLVLVATLPAVSVAGGAVLLAVGLAWYAAGRRLRQARD